MVQPATAECHFNNSVHGLKHAPMTIVGKGA